MHPLDEYVRGESAATCGTEPRFKHHLMSFVLPDEWTARHARTLVREVLRYADVGESRICDAELAVGELAANAVSHACGPYELRFVVAGGHPVWCEVIDGNQNLAGIPETFAKLHQDAAPDGPMHADETPQENGHGLAIVHELSGGRCQAFQTVISGCGLPGKAVAFALPGGGTAP